MQMGMEYGGLGKKLVMAWSTWARYQGALHFSTVRVLCQNHYETLGLEKDCSAVAIRDSFIRLSKELHPDTNLNSREHHQRFVAVNEAYSVLSRPHLRQTYDSQLGTQGRPDMYTHDGIRTNAPRQKEAFRDGSFWENRDRGEDYKYEGRSYYGVRGINKKLPNSYIATGAVIFMVVGAIFHFFVARVSSNFTLEQLNRRDIEASQHHMVAREAAKANGNQLQMTLLKQRIEAKNHNK